MMLNIVKIILVRNIVAIDKYGFVENEDYIIADIHVPIKTGINEKQIY